jgi:hypothetical protein
MQSETGSTVERFGTRRGMENNRGEVDLAVKRIRCQKTLEHL